MRKRRRGYDRDFSIDLTKHYDEMNGEFSDLSRPITPAELEKCMNNMRCTIKSVKEQKARKGLVVNKMLPKETLMTQGTKRNHESIVGENETLQTNGKEKIYLML